MPLRRSGAHRRPACYRRRMMRERQQDSPHERAADRTGGGSGLFPPAGHDHRACAADTLARAEATCRRHGLTLSPGRRRVLEALAVSHAPVGAYDIIERLAASGPRPAPITVEVETGSGDASSSVQLRGTMPPPAAAFQQH